jgi:hypothetical protein
LKVSKVNLLLGIDSDSAQIPRTVGIIEIFKGFIDGFEGFEISLIIIIIDKFIGITLVSMIDDVFLGVLLIPEECSALLVVVG